MCLILFISLLLMVSMKIQHFSEHECDSLPKLTYIELSEW